MYFSKILKLINGMVLISLLCITGFVPIIHGQTAFFPVAKIRPGLTGYGYTVFEGTKVEKFKVKVLAVIGSGYRQDKFILVKLSGDRLEKNGGLSAGMSGSPVYIRGKLVGAISYGFENGDPFLALVTPIEIMARLMDEQVTQRLIPAGLKTDFHMEPVPVRTPVIVSGMGRRGFELIQKSLQEYNLAPVFVPSSGIQGVDGRNTALRPGSAISVQMVTGDYQVSALGTVTLIDNQQFLAFGHSFTNQGAVDYLAFTAFIFRTVKNQAMPFKFGAPVSFIGSITNDRQAGILGRLGKTPDLIQVNANIKDNDTNRRHDHHFQVVQNEQVYRDLIISGITDAIDKTIDRVGGGTATVTFEIVAKDETQLIVRQNLFYGKDIAVNCLKDLKAALDLIASNEYAPVPLKSITIDAIMCNQQVSARIVKLNSELTKARPGDTITVRTTIRPYRGAELTVPFTIKLPENLEPGKLTLSVQSGSKYLPEENEDAKKDETKTGHQNLGSISALLANFTDSPKNNELIFEYRTVNAKKAEAVNPGGENKLKQDKLKAATDYFLVGEAQLTLDIANQ